MTDHSDLIERLRWRERVLEDGSRTEATIDRTREYLREAADALSSQSLALSEARAENDRKDAEIERLKGLVAGIRECPQEPWQEITTAPKDGTWVELYRPPPPEGRWESRITARWFNFEEGEAAWAWPDQMFSRLSVFRGCSSPERLSPQIIVEG